MSEPEIARRCVGCGAAVRGAARACPQCGHDAEAATVASAPPAPWEQMRAGSKLPPMMSARDDNHSAGLAGEAEHAPEDDVPLTVAPSQPEQLERHPLPAASVPRVAAARGERVRQRAAVVGENLRPRVERLRDASIVVLDEASDDPSLRFVLVALLLFGLFLLFLVLSFVFA